MLTVGVGQMWGATYTLAWGSVTSGSNYTNFTGNSGTVTNIVSFSCTQNSAANAAAYNSTDKELRLYYKNNGNGNSITLTPATNITITGFEITATSSYTASETYSVDGGAATSLTWSSTTATVSGISCTSSIVIQNVSTTTQFRIKKIVITYSVATPRNVGWSANGVDWSSEGSPSTSVTSGGKVSSLPTAPTSSACDGDKKFAGWSASTISGTTNTKPSDLFTIASEAPTVTADVTYYAVFANQVSAGGTSENLFNVTSYGSIPTGWANSSVTTGSYFLFDAQNDALTSPLLDPHDNVQVTCSVATYSTGTNNNLTVQLLDKDGNVMDSKTTATPSSSDYISSGTLSFGKINYKFKIKFLRTASSGRGVRLQSMKCTGTTLPTYNGYRTSCCTPLASINGSISLSKGKRTDSPKQNQTQDNSYVWQKIG